VAAGRHRANTAAWCCGLATAAAVFLTVPGLVVPAGWAFTGGCAVALAAATLMLLRGAGAAEPGPPAGGAALSGVTTPSGRA
jgi:hypothetical protein